MNDLRQHVFSCRPAVRKIGGAAARGAALVAALLAGVLRADAAAPAAQAAGPKKRPVAAAATKIKTVKPVSSKTPAGAAAATPSNAGPAFVDNTPLTQEQRIVHVLDRLGFGPRPGDVERVKQMGLGRYIARQLLPETINDDALEAKLAPLAARNASPQELTQAYEEGRRIAVERRKQMTAADMAPTMAAPAIAGAKEAPAAAPQSPGRKDPAAGALVFQANRDMQMAKIVRAVESERQLNEVLADFWSNHFNIDQRKNQCRYLKVVDEREVIRPHVVGKFRDLLGASAHSPAMLVYLDNAQSQVPQPVNGRNRQFGTPGQKRGGINENYAREIMELHTLGVDGGYTQKDVQEVARCFTGWSIDRPTGTFRFYPRRHDNGEKIVLGRVIPAGGGEKDGEAVLDILASHPATARFVSRKLCQRFVSDEPPTALVSRCAQVWQRTGGDLREVVRTIVTSPEFFSRAAYRQKIKSPFEFAVSSVRALGGTFDFDGARRVFARSLRAGGLKNGNGYQGALRQTLVAQIGTMGQPLFQYQAPTGYPEDSRKWVSSGALIARLNFALGLVGGRIAPEIKIEPLLAPNQTFARPGDALNVLADRLLGGEMSPATRATLLKQATTAAAAAPASETNATTNTTAVARLTALVLGSPEFQRR